MIKDEWKLREFFCKYLLTGIMHSQRKPELDFIGLEKNKQYVSIVLGYFGYKNVIAAILQRDGFLFSLL